jgi:hypothetical protein
VVSPSSGRVCCTPDLLCWLAGILRARRLGAVDQPIDHGPGVKEIGQ